MEKEFEVYINKVVKRLECGEEEKADIAEEILDHLVLLKKEFIEEGYSEDEAVKLAISTFGNEDKIRSALQNEMIPHLRFIKLFGGLICGVLTILMIDKGIMLWNMGTNVDGHGIGIYFLLFEINDRVPEQNIPDYAIGFFISSIITALVPIVLVTKKILTFKNS